VKVALARQFLEAVVAHDFETAEELLDPDVETVTPRGSLRGVAACRQVLQKASGDEQFAMEQAEPEFEEIEGDVIARTHEVARWRETGEVAYERDFAVRLTLDDDRVVRIVVMPGGRGCPRRSYRFTGGLTAALPQLPTSRRCWSLRTRPDEPVAKCRRVSEVPCRPGGVAASAMPVEIPLRRLSMESVAIILHCAECKAQWLPAHQGALARLSRQ
jgi:ketosteroid isomerase-like protein